jgi:hypothetical protein
MKTYPRKTRCRAHHPRVPAFSPAPTRERADGWTPARQAAFLAHLAVTRSVSAAARKVKMARETAYRLRRRRGGESFAAAWDAVLGRSEGKRKVTSDERRRRAIDGLLKPVIYRGRHVGTMEKADNTALLGHLALLGCDPPEAEEACAKSQSFGYDFASLWNDEIPPRPGEDQRQASRYAWSKPNWRAFSRV